MDKENVMDRYIDTQSCIQHTNEIIFSHKKKEILPFVTIRIDPRAIS